MKYIYATACFLLILTSCKSKRKIINQSQQTTANNAEYKNKQVLLQNLKKNEVQFTTVSGKFECEAVIDSSKNSFNVNLRIFKDSLIWMSISPALGIEVARVLITKDSVKFLNRLNSSFFIGDFQYISKLLNADLDYELLQSLLVGNSVEFYEDDDKLRSATDGTLHLLTTTRKRKLRKVLEKNKEYKDPMQSIWLQPTTYKISRILFNEFSTDRSFNADFSKFQMVDSTIFPSKIKYVIKAEKQIAIDIDYSKIQLNKELSFQFTIPEKYDRINYEQKKDK
ncbi:MAG: DUF4292 domain-containing protein [Bacteroidetes bacterium]|nr:DUF4292 domain-containing protein [Bacteroidota bacterium]